ncbi:MAG TPA: condensation domain-containing protein [Thermoanaerobaculia bacterium]
MLADLLAYWRQRLDGAPELLELASDRPRPPLQSYRGGRLAVHLPRATGDALSTLVRQEGGTLFMALVTVFTSLLRRHCGQDDILIGSPIANRTRPEIEPLIGFFVNTLVLRTTFTPGLTARGLLAQVRQTTLEAYQHQELSFEKLVEDLQPRRDASHTPLFQVLLTFQGSPVSALPARDLTLRVASPQKTAVAFDLDLTLQNGPEGIWGALGFARDFFDQPTSQRLLDHFERLAAEIATDPDRQLEDLPLLSAAERQALLVEWNDTAVGYDLRTSYSARFAAQAARTPEAPAIGCDGAVWSYRKLRRHNLGLARRLRSHGAGRAGGGGAARRARSAAGRRRPRRARGGRRLPAARSRASADPARRRAGRQRLPAGAGRGAAKAGVGSGLAPPAGEGPPPGSAALRRSGRRAQ